MFARSQEPGLGDKQRLLVQASSAWTLCIRGTHAAQTHI